MSKEQIEEIAKKLKAYCYDIKLNDVDDCRRLAEFIIDTLGYRKQRDGEWKLGESGYIYFGSCCGYAALAREEEDWNFCPHCGAKMKGGEER